MSGTLKVGDALPSDVTFSYIPYTAENSDITSCGIPINYDASKGKSTASSKLPSVDLARPREHPYPYARPPAKIRPSTLTPFLCRVGR